MGQTQDNLVCPKKMGHKMSKQEPTVQGLALKVMLYGRLSGLRYQWALIITEVFSQLEKSLAAGSEIFILVVAKPLHELKFY